MDSLDPCSSFAGQTILANKYSIKPYLVVEEDFTEPRMVQRMVYYTYWK
jgi:hypothetical protein